MSKKSVLEKLKKQIQAFGKDANSKYPSGVEKYDWGFAPIMTDGKANVGFKRAPLGSEEALGKGVQGPIDPRTNYKYQRITPDGRIQRTVVTNGNGDRYTITPWDNVFASDVEANNASKRWMPVMSGWGKDLNGNWYRLEDANLPLAEAREMKNSWRDAFEGVDMRGKMSETRKPGLYEADHMKRIARNPYRITSDMLAESKDFPGESRLMVQNKKDLYAAQTADAAKRRDAAQQAACQQQEAIRAQIAELQKKITELENEKNQIRPWKAGMDEYEAATVKSPYKDYKDAYTGTFNTKSYKK